MARDLGPLVYSRRFKMLLDDDELSTPIIFLLHSLLKGNCHCQSRYQYHYHAVVIITTLSLPSPRCRYHHHAVVTITTLPLPSPRCHYYTIICHCINNSSPSPTISSSSSSSSSSLPPCHIIWLLLPHSLINVVNCSSSRMFLLITITLLRIQKHSESHRHARTKPGT